MALPGQWYWLVRPVCCHSLQSVESTFPAPPTATMSGWAKLQQTFLNHHHHLPVPWRVERDAADRRSHGWNPPCFHFFIHLITLEALRICSASLGTAQWLLGVFMPGNDHLIRAEAPSHPRHCLTLKLWEGGGCIISDQVQSNVIAKSVEKLHKDPDSILFLLYLSSHGTELEVDWH